MTTDTTAPSRTARPYGVAMLGVAVSAGAVAGVVVAVLGVVLGGSTGLVGALAGAAVTVLVLATGFAVVDLVAGLMPTASLIVAMLTYTLQVAALALLLGALRAADDIESSLSPSWFGAGVIAVALAWTVCLVRHAMRARIPAYDLPEPVGVGSAEGSER